MNNTQIQTTLAPVIAFIAGILAAKFAFWDLATWSAILTGVLGLGATIATALFATRTNALADIVGNLPNTTVVTTPSIANALPHNDSVVSVTENKVVPK